MNQQTASPTEQLPVPKMAPVQGYQPGIPWELHLEAYAEYCKRYGKQDSLITGWCRGGFGTSELDMFIPGWRDKVGPINDLKKRLERAEALLREFVQWDKDYPKGSIHDYKGSEKLDALFASASQFVTGEIASSP